MSSNVETIFEYTNENGKIIIFGIDDENRLYWNNQIIVTEQKLKLTWWVNAAIIVSGFSTLVIALIAVFTFVKTYYTFNCFGF